MCTYGTIMSVLIPTMIGKHHLKLDMPGEFSNKVLQKCLTTTYLLPNITVPAEEEIEPIGLWGKRHARHLKEHYKVLYMNLLTSGKLHSYLAEVDKQAEDMFLRLVKEYADRQDVTEQLKKDNPYEWIGRMNNIQACVREVVGTELIYT